MHYIGIDPSLTGSAVVVVMENGEIACQKLFSTTKADNYECRMIDLGVKILEVVGSYRCGVPVHIEGIAFGARGASIAEMAALNYHLRILMTEQGITFKVVPATVLKKFICGKGNVKKEQMLLQVYKKFGIEFKDNNLCDAYCLARVALNDFKSPPIIAKRRTL